MGNIISEVLLTAKEQLDIAINNAKDTLNEMGDIIQQIEDSDVISEVHDARGSSATLNDRLNGINSQLEDITNKINIKNVITVSRFGDGNFKTINEAVEYCRTLTDLCLILVYPGVYEESVKIIDTDNVYGLIGLDKKHTVVIQKHGHYSAPPLWTHGDFYCENMTFINNHNNPFYEDITKLHGYAYHCENRYEGLSEFFNCEFISYQNAAIGAGFHTNEKLKLVNCEITSLCPKDHPMIDNGAMFFHNSTYDNVTGQSIEMINCNVQSGYGKYAMYINDANKTVSNGNGNNFTAYFLKNRFLASGNADESIIRIDTPNNENCVSGCIKLGYSYLNNIDLINTFKYKNTISKAITPINGATNYGNSFEPLTLIKNDNQIVLRGLIKIDTVADGTIIGNIPTGYLPLNPSFHLCVGNVNSTTWVNSIISVEKDGSIILTNKNGALFIQINATWYV